MSLLADALKTKLIPWSRQSLSERFIVAREKMSLAQMSDGVTLERRKIVGQRVVVKNRRYYGNTRGHSTECRLYLVPLGHTNYRVIRFCVCLG